MNLTELGFDYSNLNSCLIKRKNYIIAFVGAILALVFLPIFIAFLVIYLLEVPLDINDVMTNFGEPAYQQFFGIFLPLIGGVSIIVIILTLVGVFSKPKTYMIIDKDKTNFDTFYYIHNHKKNELIYMTSDYMLVYNQKYKSMFEESNKKIINEVINRFVFWKNFDKINDYKIKHKKKRTVLSYKPDAKRSYSSGLTKTYYFSNEIQVVPIKVSEMISYSGRGRNNIQGFVSYYFENINRRQPVDIHPEIRKKLISFI